MSKNKNITPENNKGQAHGLWEEYYCDGKLWYKCFFHNDKLVGYEECCSYDGKITIKQYNL